MNALSNNGQWKTLTVRALSSESYNCTAQRTRRGRLIFISDESVEGTKVILVPNAGSSGIKALTATGFCYKRRTQLRSLSPATFTSENQVERKCSPSVV